MNTSDLTAIIGLSISAIIFILLASRAKSTKFSLLGFTMADKKIKRDQYGASMVAASSSLATVIIFFLTNAKYFGITLLWCGATYLAGQFIFTLFVRKKDIISEDVRTVSDLWYYTIRSKSNSLLITALTFTSFLIILFIELYIGSVIFSYFFQSYTEYASIISFFIVGLIVIYYVRIGGLRAVMQTDGWQLMLMLCAVASLFLFGFLAQTDSGYYFEFSKVFDFDADWKSVIFFWIWILVINFTLPFTQLSSWQRVAACESGEEVWKGFKSHIIQFSIIWFIPVIAFAILASKGFTFSTLNELLDLVKLNGGLSEFILYPMIVVGFGSALFSTADTALIAITTSFADTNTYKNRLEKLSVKKLKLIITVISLATMLLLSGIFYISQANVGSWFMPLIYNIFGQLAIIAPLIIYSLFNMDKEPIKLKSVGNLLISLSIIIAWIGTLYTTYLSIESGNQLWSQISTPIGILITALGLIVGIKFKLPKSETND